MDEVPDDTSRTTVAPMDAPRTQIGRYLVMEQIGAGGMAEVFRARGPGGRQVVLKRIHPALSMRKGAVDMFLREARLALELDHENVVKVYEVGKDPEGLFIAMELLDGLALNRLAKRFWANDRGLPLEAVLHMGAQAAAGLAHAHGHGRELGAPRLVHRDVSPDNLFLHRPMMTGPDEPTRVGSVAAVVKVLDFGVAKQLEGESLTRTGVIKGKLPFLAPEIIEGAEASPSSDLYSLGISLYWLVAGRRPFSGPDLKLMTAIVKDPPAPMAEHNEDCPAVLDELVLSMLEKRPANRPADALEVTEALTSILGRLPSGWSTPGEILDEALGLNATRKVKTGWGSLPSVGWPAGVLLPSRSLARASTAVGLQQTITDSGAEATSSASMDAVFSDDTQKARPAVGDADLDDALVDRVHDETAEGASISDDDAPPGGPMHTELMGPALVTSDSLPSAGGGNTVLMGSAPAEATEPSAPAAFLSPLDADALIHDEETGRLPEPRPPTLARPAATVVDRVAPHSSIPSAAVASSVLPDETRVQRHEPAPPAKTRSKLWPVLWVGLGLLGGLSINALVGGSDDPEGILDPDDAAPAEPVVGHEVASAAAEPNALPAGRDPGSSNVEPSVGDPSEAEPDEAEPSTAEPGETDLGDGDPSGTDPDLADPSEEGSLTPASGEADPDEAEASKPGPPSGEPSEVAPRPADPPRTAGRSTRRPRARRSSKATPKATTNAIQLKGPSSVRWESMDGKTLRKGQGRVQLALGAKHVLAIDTKTGGRSRVPVVKGVADYRRLKKGELTVIARPWAEVSMGRVKLGPTPIAPTKLVEGRYKLKLEHPGANGVAAVKYKTVDIRPGQTTTARVSLRP